jgi:hypothetical protein
MAKRTLASGKPVYVNKITNAEIVSKEGRITQATNTDDMRAIVGKIVCGSVSRSPACRWPAMIVEMASPASLDCLTDERELQAGSDLIIWGEPEGFPDDRL